MGYRCEQCDMIPLVRIHNPNEYIMCIESFNRMIVKGEMELVYATCPLDQIIDEQGRFYTRKLFHQFRCTNCSAVYGMYVDATQGGEIKLNDKIFVPEEYEEKDGE